jgi:hypothetical protein
MGLHRDAKLGLRGRRDLVGAIEGGMSLTAAAAAFSVSPATRTAVAAVELGWRGGAAVAGRSGRSVVSSASVRRDAVGGRAGADLRGPPPCGLGGRG